MIIELEDLQKELKDMLLLHGITAIGGGSTWNIFGLVNSLNGKIKTERDELLIKTCEEIMNLLNTISTYSMGGQSWVQIPTDIIKHWKHKLKEIENAKRP